MRFFTSEQTELMERILPHLKDTDRKIMMTVLNTFAYPKWKREKVK